MRELFLTSSDTLCTGLTTGNQSNWFPVSMNQFHTIFIKFSGISENLGFRFECCPEIDGQPGTDWVSQFSSDDDEIIIDSDKTEMYHFPNIRAGYIRINFLYVNGGTPTIDAYYYGGR